MGESKKDIHAIMPPDIYPPTIHFSVGESPEKVLRTLAENKFEYPLVGKPDMGGRGRGVKVLKNEKDVLNYINLCTVDFHIQQFINLPNEAGIFYYRLPGEANGRITGIVGKEFLSVEGDGISTIRNLLMKSDRALLQVKSLENIYGAYLDTVLPRNEKQVLVPYGNHARGAKFIDNTSVADKHLEEVIDSVCKRVKDFYFGRLDIRYNTWEELKQGKNFCVIEVNGAGSEPTHIYDPSHNLFFAWKEIIRHWHILWKISSLNHKKGHRYLSIKEGMEMFREDKENSKKIEAMPE